MKQITFGIIISLAALVSVGCNSTAPAGTDKPSSATGGNAPDQKTATLDGATTVAVAKCAECGAEKPATELKEDHGKMLCASCIAAHGH